MSKRIPEHLLLDILESIDKISIYTSDYDFNDFASSSITIDAVIRNLE